MRKLLALLPIGAAVIAIGAISAMGAGAHGGRGTVHRVNVPLSDRFVPFGLTVQVGDTITAASMPSWMNSTSPWHLGPTAALRTSTATSAPR